MALKNREKIMLIFAIIAIAIWAFDRFYYTPQKAEILRLKEEVRSADQKLRESLVFTQAVARVEAEVSRLDKELHGLRQRALRGEEFRTFLKHLARESDRLQIKIVSLVPREQNIPISKEKQGASPFQYKKVSVQMVLHSTYRTLGIYLRRIEKLPFLITIDRLQVEMAEDALPRFKVTMGLSMHIMSL